MKNYQVGKFLIVSSLVLSLPLIALASPFDQDLKYGSRGDDVMALQEFLTDQNVYAGPITGNFYSLTLAAVRKFQKAQGISPVSGYVGPITRGVINKLLDSVSFDSEGDATITPVVAQPVTPVQLPIPMGIPVSAGANSVSNVCTEQISLNVGGGKEAVRTQWNNSVPYKYTEMYIFVPKVTTACGSEWVIEYQYTGFSYDPSGTPIVTPDSGKITQNYYGLNIRNPVAGSYQVVFTAHTLNQMATSTVTLPYVSHGILSDEEWAKLH